MAMTPVFQREIVEVPFLLPDGAVKNHPALVVSVPELQEEEDGLFYAVLISTKNHHPKYTIEKVRMNIIQASNTFMVLLVFDFYLIKYWFDLFVILLVGFLDF